jgi:hypothetical protein
LLLLTTICAKFSTHIVDRFTPLSGWLCIPPMLFMTASAVWALSSLYYVEWQNWQSAAEGLIMAVLMSPLPLVVLLGLEPLLVLRADDSDGRS